MNRVLRVAVQLRDDARRWANAQSPLSVLWRAPVLLYLFYAGIRHVFDAQYGSLFAPITLVIHEAGHLVFGLFGNEWLMILGGSLSQTLAPIFVIATFALQREYFGCAVALSWLAFSDWNLATYIGDARAQELPLVGFDPNPIHDWHYLLSSVGLLKFDLFFASCVRVIALSTWLSALALGVWLGAGMLKFRK